MGLLNILSRRKPKVCQECYGTGRLKVDMGDLQGDTECWPCKGKGKIPYNRY